MALVEANGTRLWVEDTGPGSTGETVVFSHGLLFDTELFRPQIEALRGRYRVVAWDHRGQGRSVDDAHDVIGIELLTDDALALFDALGLDRVHFVGLSMGGFVGMRLAARHPARVRSLALLNTSAEPEPRKNLPRYAVLNVLSAAVGPGKLVDRILPILFGKTSMTSPERRTLRTSWREHLAKNRKSAWRAVNGVLAREGVTHLLPRITAPTLVIVGDEDVATLPEKGERIAARIPGSRLVRIARAGHSSSIEAPDAVTEALVEHLARAGAVLS